MANRGAPQRGHEQDHPTPAAGRLLPGLRLVRRDEDHLQLGIDPPRRVVLPDRPDVRALVEALAVGRRPRRLSREAQLALSAIEEAGLVSPAVTTARAAPPRVAVEAEAEDAAQLAAMLAQAGLRGPTRKTRASVIVVMVEGELSRERVDPWVRDDVAHLLVRDRGTAIQIGPFVVPGHTACLRCVDAHLSLQDPRRGLVVEQAATAPPLVPTRAEPSLRAVALALAVRDVVAFTRALEPASWSATYEVTATATTAARRWLRHPGCGCAWGDALAG
ncbi:hypothetical protein [Nocardioides sp.]|uniref:hypothetical protein n=1 Tax=Nocardioides sp. TaxID=35761 RepID=UPI0035658F1B